MAYVLALDEIDRTQVAAVGGKAANLGELSRLDGVSVPDGFCVTTAAFARILAGTPGATELLDRLAGLTLEDPEAVRTVSADLRRALEQTSVPADLAAEIVAAIARYGESAAYAVRSSATAEDLPGASFAGQQDSYLNVVGRAAVLEHVRRCWTSLFTERAVTYRLRNGYDHRQVRMAVVVQRLVVPDAAGVLFTADPVTANRTVVTVEAVPGLGEALVSGLTTADAWTVRDDQIMARTIATQRSATRVSAGGGTKDEPIAPGQRDHPVLTDEQVVRLARLGRRIEAHFGVPQDIEWCLVDGGTDDDVQVVQSRPITNVFPVPDAADGENHVYLSVGHQQMMTDAMRPLGLSMWHLTTSAVMVEAGGRLFVDVTRRLASPATRDALLDVVGTGDPLTGDALRTILDRDGYLRPSADEGPRPSVPGGAPAPIPTDPAILTGLIERSERSLATLERDIARLSGPALFDAMLVAFEEDKRLLFEPQSMSAIMAGLDASRWLNDHLLEWLGEKNVADILTQSAPHNVTSEMGLALLDVADAVRPHPEVVAFLAQVAHGGGEADDFLDALAEREGGESVRAVLQDYLRRYGMRGAGEIDITRPRWSERPTTLVPTILSLVRNFGPGAGGRRFDGGRRRADHKEQEVLARLRAQPDGEQKAAEVQQMIDRVRTFIGYREYPKYNRVSRSLVYKQALLREAGHLVRAGVLREVDDVCYLRFDELHEVVRTNRVDHRLLHQRREAYRSFQALTPPRVLTSDGETLTGRYRRDDLPPGALAGIGVSAGRVDGRARVITDMARADLEPGDILVTAFTDPSWTPLFVGIAGLVTEVGGVMTHGAVIAREYGLPAVVGVTDAVRLIRDGQRIRVHGTDGFVELLAGPVE